jgi:hypothetical protein
MSWNHEFIDDEDCLDNIDAADHDSPKILAAASSKKDSTSISSVDCASSVVVQLDQVSMKAD